MSFRSIASSGLFPGSSVIAMLVDLHSIPEEAEDTNRSMVPVEVPYERSRREALDSTSYRDGARLVTDASEMKRRLRAKPGQISQQSPLASNRELEMFNYLWKLTEQPEIQLINLDYLQGLFKEGVNINIGDEYGQTLLHALVRDWNPDTVRFAVDHGANVNVQDLYGVNPLHLAAALNFPLTCEKLLSFGARTDLRTTGLSQTPIHFAAKCNAVDTLRMLVKFDADICERDAEGRDALMLAAEYGNGDLVQCLLDLGAPAAVSTIHGTSAMTIMIEKTPRVALLAMNQFFEEEAAANERRFYLSDFEGYFADRDQSSMEKTPLEMMALLNRTSLATHPVVEKAISVKWKLLDLNRTIYQLSLTVINCIIRLILAYYLPDNSNYYSARKWTIALEIITVIISIYFFFSEMREIKNIDRDHNNWRTWKQRIIANRENYIHPKWPSDLEHEKRELQLLQNIPSLASKGKGWFIYEILQLFALVALYGTRILDYLVATKTTLLVHKMVFSGGVILAFLRFIKNLNRIQTFAVYFSVTGTLFESLSQFFLIYLQLFIPLCAAWYAMFGCNQYNTNILVEKGVARWLPIPGTNSTTFVGSYLMGLHHIIYNLYEMALVQGSTINLYRTAEPIIVRILHAIFGFLIIFIGFNTFQSFAHSNFVTNYRRCRLEALLFQASRVNKVDKVLTSEARNTVIQHYLTQLNPLVECGVLHKTEAKKEERNLLEVTADSIRHIDKILTILKTAETECVRFTCDKDREMVKQVKEKLQILKNKREAFSAKLQKDFNDILRRQEHYLKTIERCFEVSE